MHETPRLRVAIIGGGANDEHDVSLGSAAAVADAVRQLGHDAVPLTIGSDRSWYDAGSRRIPAHRAVDVLAGCDVAFPVLHGVNGEDGAIAGFLEVCGVRYVGSPVSAGAFGIDKRVTKLLAESVGVQGARSHLAAAGFAARDLPVDMRPPFVVKPVTGGSSNGVAVVDARDELAAAVDAAREFGDAVLVEEFVQGREIDIAVFRDREGTLRTGAALEIGVADGQVFDRAQKYDGTAAFTVPAPIDGELAARLRHTAELLYDTLGCRGVARFDFFVAPDRLVLNEVNTSPGMTGRSQVPLMYAALGLGYADLVSALLQTAR